MTKIHTTSLIDYDEREPWENFANGIIVQACRDYREALEGMKQAKDYRVKITHTHTIHSLNRFLRGTWYSMLTQVDPEYLIEQLNQLYGNAETTNFINKYATFETERI